MNKETNLTQAVESIIQPWLNQNLLPDPIQVISVSRATGIPPSVVFSALEQEPLWFSVNGTKIKTKLAADHPGSMKHIRVDTDKDGVVWLTGTANTQDEINKAITTARNTDGVKSVWSDLTIKLDR